MENITLVKDAIHRPDEPRHFMQFKFPDKRFIASIGNVMIAKTDQPLMLSEVGYAIYEPVIYFPIKDVAIDQLSKIEKSTFCPLKGDTEYFDLKDAKTDGEKEIAWRYSRPLNFAQQLQDYIAFDPNKIAVERTPRS